MAARTPSATSACDIVAETTSHPTANLYRPVQPSPPGDRRKDVVGKKSSEHAVPHAMQQPDRAPKERYYDPDFFELEAEQLWPRIWQMACRLEEIPEPGDFVEYEILDQSIIVQRGDDMEVRAFQNACRHRGVKVVVGSGSCDSFTCPFHGWCYGQDGKNTHIPQRKMFAESNLAPGEIDLTPVRCELWGACAWINLDDGAPPLRECIEPAASILDAWMVDTLRTEWWFACRLPVNWKLAQQAFQEQYHVVEAHPQLVIPGMRYSTRPGQAFDPRAYVDAELKYLRTMSEGMEGMVHANDLRIAEGLRDIELPADPALAAATWDRTLNDAVVEWHRSQGHPVPDLNQLVELGINEPMRSEEHTSELQSLMRISYAVFCLKKKKQQTKTK